MLTILVFHIKEGKNAQKIKKLLTIIKKGPGFCMCFYKQMSMIM